MNWKAVSCVLLAAAPVQAGPPWQPADSQALAAIDLAQVKPEDRPYTRYLRVPTGDAKDVKVGNFGLNWTGSKLPYLTPAIGGGNLPLLMRVDLRQFCETDADLRRWLKVWEELTFDPNFSVLYTHDTLKLILDAGGEKPKWLIRLLPATKQLAVSAPAYKGADGKTYTEKWVDVVRFPQAALDPGTLAYLERETRSSAPVVDLDYYLNRALYSINGAVTPSADDGVYKTVFGGLYYDFAGIRTAAVAGKKKATDLDVLFEDLGIIDDADGPVKAFDKINRLGSDQRIAIIRSNVTGKMRQVIFFPTLKSVRVQGVLVMTMDVNDQTIDLLSNVFLNMLAFQGLAIEALWVDSTGSQKGALFKVKDGSLQREVPADIANDTTIPHPHTQRLQAGVGCYICHGEHDGWQPLKNDGADLLPRLLADLSDRKKFTQEQVNRIKKQYQGNADELLMSLRRGSIRSMLEVGGPWEPPKDWDQKKQDYQLGTYKLMAGRLDLIRRRYWYPEQGVTAAILLAELGYDPGKATAVEFLEKYLQDGEVEDPRILQLKEGKGIPRTQAELVKGFLAGRLQVNIAIQRKERP